MNNDTKLTAGLAILATVSTVTGIFLGFAIANADWKREAVQRGAAHYDVKTGEFTWSYERKTP